MPLAALLLLACAGNNPTSGPEITYAPQPAFNPPTYVCYKAPAPITIDGKLTAEEWDAVPWTSDFTDIEGEKRPAPHFRTRAKMIRRTRTTVRRAAGKKNRTTDRLCNSAKLLSDRKRRGSARSECYRVCFYRGRWVLSATR